MQDREDPTCIRQLLETNMFLRPWDRAQLMKRACDLFEEAGLNKEAIQSHWDRMLFQHSRHELAEEATGRFGTGSVLGHEFPDSAFFTDDVLDYYERRAHETANPTLKSWYADFIWERRHKYEFALMAIRALHDAYPIFERNAREWTPVTHPALESLDVELARILKSTWWNQAADAVVRPLRLARMLKSPTLIREAKTKLLAALEDFHAHDRDKHNRIIQGAIEALLEGRDVAREELQCVRQIASEGEQYFVGKGSPGGAKSMACLEAQVAKHMSDTKGHDMALIRVGHYLEMRAANTDAMSYAIGMQLALEHYTRIGSSSDIERLKKETSNAWASTRVSGVFKTLEIRDELPLEEVKSIARKMLAHGLERGLVELARAPEYEPSIDEVREIVRELGESYPLTRLINRIQLEDTRQIHKADTPEQSEEAAVREQYSLQAGLSGAFLHASISLFRNEGGLDVATLMAVLRRIPFLNDEQSELIEKGLERYFAGDYISALHILTPQLEDVLRRLVGQRGGATTTFRNGVMRERELWQILNAPELATVFEPDVLYFLKHVFVEILGLNLRNRVGHGLVRPVDCTDSNCALVIISLLRVAACIEPSGQEEDHP